MPRPPDIIVIGAGIVGCAIAYELARRGASVQIVEERTAGMGATQAAAGILAPHIEVSSPTPFLELAVRSLNLFDDFLAREVPKMTQSYSCRCGTSRFSFDSRSLNE